LNASSRLVTTSRDTPALIPRPDVTRAIRGRRPSNAPPVTGLRAEEIRKTLGLDVREVSRVLKEGLRTKKLKSKGEKRATVYSVA
jgi:hypothetical protein